MISPTAPTMVLYRAAVMGPHQPELVRMQPYTSAKASPSITRFAAMAIAKPDDCTDAAMLARYASDHVLPEMTTPYLEKQLNLQDQQHHHPETPCWGTTDTVRVKALPMYYRPEKYSATFPRAKLQAVLYLLQEIFRTDSLKVNYRNGSSTETVAAHCESMDGVQFVVQVWENCGTNHRVVVQRTAGDGMMFCKHGYAKRVLSAVHSCAAAAAATTKPWGAEEAPAANMDPLAFSMDAAHEQQRQMDSMMKGVPLSSTLHFAAHQTSEDDIASAVAIVEDLLLCRRCDRVSLGLASLVALTDPNSSGYTTALTVAHTVLLGGTELSDIVLCLALAGRWPASAVLIHDDDDSDDSHAFSALTVAAQAINLMDNAGIIEFVNRVPRDLVLVDTLLRSVHDAYTSPHAAYLAAHILACLCRAVPDIRALVGKHLPTVQLAQHVGTCSHAALAQASHRLLQELDAA